MPTLPTSTTALRIALPLTLAAALAGAAAVPVRPAPPAVRPVAELDTQRLAGTWFEIARLPSRFQAQCASDATAHYEPQADGSLRVTNSCRTPTGKMETFVGRAWPAQRKATAGKLKVSFLPRWLQWLPVGQGDFWVVMRDAGYRWVVLSDPERQNLWLLSRDPALPADQLERIVDRLAAQGYPTRQLVLTKQSAVLREIGADQADSAARRPHLMV